MSDYWINPYDERAAFWIAEENPEDNFRVQAELRCKACRAVVAQVRVCDGQRILYMASRRAGSRALRVGQLRMNARDYRNNPHWSPRARKVAERMADEFEREADAIEEGKLAPKAAPRAINLEVEIQNGMSGETSYRTNCQRCQRSYDVRAEMPTCAVRLVDPLPGTHC